VGTSADKSGQDGPADLIAVVHGATVTVRDPVLSEELHTKSSFGWFQDSPSLVLSLSEAHFLLERERIEVVDEEGKKLDIDGLVRHASTVEEDFFLRYRVYRDLRVRGYVVKSGLKYGTHFRVYERGVRPRKGRRSVQEHAKFLVHATSESYQCSVPELTRLVRLAHSVKKRIWMGVVDSEGDVTYLQVIRVTP